MQPNFIRLLTTYAIAGMTIGACDEETTQDVAVEASDESLITLAELGLGDESVAFDRDWVAHESSVLRCTNDEGNVEELSGRALVHPHLDMEALAGDERMLRSCALETSLEGPRELSGLVSEAKAAAPFVLTPAPQNTALGASRLTQQALRPVGPIASEAQYAEFRVSASELLKDSQEHIAVSLMATDQPFTAGGAWTTTAPGGGIGIALGAISSQFHPACPADLNNSRVEFAIERFGANDPNASTLIKCVSFAKTVLISAPTFKITVSTDCVANSCYTTATLRNAATNAVLASVSAPSVTRANTTRLRKVWYAVTDFDKVDAKRYSATFEVLTEEYYAEPQGGPLP